MSQKSKLLKKIVKLKLVKSSYFLAAEVKLFDLKWNIQKKISISQGESEWNFLAKITKYNVKSICKRVWILFELVWTCLFVLIYLFVESNHASFFRQNTKVKLFVRPKAWENFSNSRWISESKLLFIFSTSSLPNWDVIIMDQYFGHFINHTGENKIFLSQQRKVIYLLCDLKTNVVLTRNNLVQQPCDKSLDLNSFW